MQNMTLISTFALANPVGLEQLYKKIQDDDPSDADALLQEILGYANHEPFLSHWNSTDPPAVQSLSRLYPHNKALENDKTRKQVYHVFPVWVDRLQTGMMVPVAVDADDDWSGTALFSSFSTDQRKNKNDPKSLLLSLLKNIEQCWAELYPGQQLPLRWRNTYSFHVLCPLPLAAIAGNSLQVPLIIMLLRSFCITPDKLEQSGSLSLGNNPVFATGSFNSDDNTFGKVMHVVDKAKAFLREYGSELPAILTCDQIKELKKAQIKDLFSPIIEANDLSELLDYHEFKQGLERLAGPPHPTEIDNLLKIMGDAARGIRFDDVAGLATWLLPQIESPVYRFRLHRQIASVFGHMGRFTEMKPHIDSCGQLLAQSPDLFGLTDRCNLATTTMILAEDMMEPEPTLEMLESLRPLEDIPIENKVALWGSRCQALRIMGRLDESIDAGREAVRLADLGRASDSGRDRNYLIHALIDRIRMDNDGKQKTKDLKEAETLLVESEVDWAPRDSDSARHSHLTFCLHLRAELARLRGESFILPDKAPWQGYWDHAWYFAMLSCARNRSLSMEDRRKIAGDLVKTLQKSPPPSDSLYFMFLQVYRIYTAFLEGTHADQAAQELCNWCDNLAEKEFPGWKNRLQPVIDKIAVREENAAELLCSAIHYH